MRPVPATLELSRRRSSPTRESPMRRPRGRSPQRRRTLVSASASAPSSAPSRGSMRATRRWPTPPRGSRPRRATSLRPWVSLAATARRVLGPGMARRRPAAALRARPRRQPNPRARHSSAAPAGPAQRGSRQGRNSPARQEGQVHRAAPPERPVHLPAPRPCGRPPPVRMDPRDRVTAGREQAPAMRRRRRGRADPGEGRRRRARAAREGPPRAMTRAQARAGAARNPRRRDAPIPDELPAVRSGRHQAGRGPTPPPVGPRQTSASGPRRAPMRDVSRPAAGERRSTSRDIDEGLVARLVEDDRRDPSVVEARRCRGWPERHVSMGHEAAHGSPDTRRASAGREVRGEYSPCECLAIQTSGVLATRVLGCRCPSNTRRASVWANFTGRDPFRSPLRPRLTMPH